MADTLRQLQLLRRGSPIGQYEYQVVTFPVAGVDVRIRHELKAVPYTQVYYMVIQQDAPASIYHSSFEAWDQNHIALRSDTSGTTATLLLFTQRS